MSNSTLLAPANAPVNAPVKSPVITPAPSSSSAPAPADFVAPASSPVGTLVVPKVPPSYNISWIGIVGILAAFLVLAIITLVCFWYKKLAFKRALREQRELYAANGTSPNHKVDLFDDEEAARSKRGQMILTDFELALGSLTSSKRFSEEDNAGCGDNAASGERIVEQDIPVYTRDKHVVGSFKEKHVSVGIRNKNMSGGFNWNSLGENVVDEVFYKGEEGSQMGVRYSRTDFDNIEIFARVPLSPREAPKKKRSESESASLLGTLSRSHALDILPGKEKTSNKREWTLRTFSLPTYHRKPSQEARDTSLGLKVECRVESLSKGISALAPHPNSLPSSPKHSYSPTFAFGNNLISSPWAQKPSRLSAQSNAVLHNPTFIVPPSTPPPPLSLPVTLDETDGQEKTLKELRKAMKQAESKWSIANYCPSAPPPPLPIPFQPSSPAPTTPCSKPKSVPPPPPPPPPPPFPTLPCKRFPQPPSPPPFPTLPCRKFTPPPSPPPFPDDGSKLTPPLSPPQSSEDGKKFTPPPSPPPFPTLPCKRFTPPPSPPPPALPGSASRPKLTPLILPGRPILEDNSEDFRTKPRSPRRQQRMRALHWDKLKPESRTTMVWDNISNSMELDEEMIENLFGVTTMSASESEGVRKSSLAPITEKNEILDPRKAHNISIQLRARGLAKVEVCDALLEGDGLGLEILELLVKMNPTNEEVTKFQEYQGDPTLLGPADRFVQGILQIPSAFERLQAMHYRASHGEELHQIQETITTLEMACKELKESRTFTKLLEAVLKTGNRLNTGTFRGDAKAFKLDTLLKLADVKGVDGKTTLLHFVIQEIIKAEGARAARLAGFHDPSTPTSTMSSVCTTPSSTASPSSPLSHFARSMEAELERCQNEINNSDGRDDFRRIGMDVVRGIPSELGHVRKAGGLDILALRLAVSRLQTGLQDMKATLEKLRVSGKQIGTKTRTTTYDLNDDVFREKMMLFVEDAETQVSVVQNDLELVLASVKDISVYFYGEADTAKSAQPLKVFMVMREFLAMLEQACKDVMKANASLLATPPNSRPPSRPRSLVTASK